MEQHAHTLKPYLIQAVYNWCLDTQLTPYIEVVNFEKNKIPAILFENRSSMVFNISKRGASKFTFLPEGVQFKTKIDGQIQSIFANYHGIKKIYAKELGHGLEFSTLVVNNESVDTAEDGDEWEKQEYEKTTGHIDKQKTSSLDPDSKLVLIVNNHKKNK